MSDPRLPRNLEGDELLVALEAAEAAHQTAKTALRDRGPRISAARFNRLWADVQSTHSRAQRLRQKARAAGLIRPDRKGSAS